MQAYQHQGIPFEQSIVDVMLMTPHAEVSVPLHAAISSARLLVWQGFRGEPGPTSEGLRWV